MENLRRGSAGPGCGCRVACLGRPPAGKVGPVSSPTPLQSGWRKPGCLRFEGRAHWGGQAEKTQISPFVAAPACSSPGGRDCHRLPGVWQRSRAGDQSSSFRTENGGSLVGQEINLVANDLYFENQIEMIRVCGQ